MQDVRDKIAQVRPGFPARREGPAGDPRRPGEPAAGGVAGGAVADHGSARADLAHRPDRSSRGWRTCRAWRSIDVNGRVTRQILVQIKPQRADRARHRRRPGRHRHPHRQPGRAGGTHHARRAGLHRARRRQDQGPGAVRADHRRAAGRRAGVPVAGRRRHRRREGGDVDRAHQRPAARSRSTCRRRRTPTSSRPARASTDAVATLQQRLPAEVELRVVDSTADAVERSVNRVKETIVEGALLTVLIVFLFLHSLAQHDHHRAHAADRGHRDLHRAVRLRLHAQLPDADGAVAVHRPADRRRDRRAREHRAPPRDGQGPRHRRARGHRRDRPRGDGDDLRHRRGVRADRLHERHHRPLFLPVRADGRRRGAGVAVRELHARPDALVGVARSRRRRASRACRGSAASWIASSRASNGSTHLRPRPRVGARASRQGDADRAGQLRGELPGRAAGRYRVHSRSRPEFHFAAPQHAGRLEPRIHRRQGAAGRGVAQGVSRDRAGDDHRRHRRRPQLRRGSTSSLPTAARAAARRRRSSARSAPQLKPIPGIELAIGFDRPVWVNLLGPDPERR